MHIRVSLSKPEIQAKANLEKTKQSLEKEVTNLNEELHSLGDAKQDLEHKRKKMESQLCDLQTCLGESERQKGELGETVSKLTVSLLIRYFIKKLRKKFCLGLSDHCVSFFKSHRWSLRVQIGSSVRQKARILS